MFEFKKMEAFFSGPHIFSYFQCLLKVKKDECGNKMFLKKWHI